MLTLCIRTDKPESELYLLEDDQELDQVIWQAHRELAETIHTKIDELLKAQNKKLADIEKIVLYKGPGSFTGLRIGASIANALAYSLDIPIGGTTGDDWTVQGQKAPESRTPITPEYGQEPHITKQKK